MIKHKCSPAFPRSCRCFLSAGENPRTSFKVKIPVPRSKHAGLNSAMYCLYWRVWPAVTKQHRLGDSHPSPSRRLGSPR